MSVGMIDEARTHSNTVQIDCLFWYRIRDLERTRNMFINLTQTNTRLGAQEVLLKKKTAIVIADTWD